MNQSTLELMVQAAWGLCGFVAGYFVGRLGVEVHEIKETVCEHPDCEDDHATTAKVSHVGTLMRGVAAVPDRIVHTKTGAGILIVLAVLSTILGFVNSNQRAEQAKCFTDYNIEFARVYSVRARAADKDRSSLNKLILTLQSTDRSVREKAFRQYVDEIQTTDAERQRSPLPVPPDPTTFCKR